jgi:simple sugar transport system permease protein
MPSPASRSTWLAGLSGPAVRIALGFAVLSLLSGAFDAPDLFSRGGISATLRFSAPILLAGLGALWAERSGVINLGLEGMMIAGTWFGAWAAIEWGIGPGLVAGIAAGVAFVAPGPAHRHLRRRPGDLACRSGSSPG